jgi:DNA polymerase-4
VVAGCSYEARVFGAHSAMPMHQARRLVGSGAVVLPPRGSVYRAVSLRVFALIRAQVPVIEMLSFDEAFAEPAELAGATADDAIEFAQRLRTRISDEIGLAASVGFGSGKQIAKIASGMAKPDGVVVVTPEHQGEFLARLPVRKLWGIGPVAGERLQRLGIDTIGDLARMSTLEVSSVLGATVGPGLHQLARGIDDRPVAERASAKQISAESTFAEDITDLGRLRGAVDRAAASAHRRLLADGRGSRTVVVKLKKSDMSVLTRSSTLPAATTELPVLTAAAQRLALDPQEIGPIRLVGVGYSGLSAVQQFALFPELDGTFESAESSADSTPQEMYHPGGRDPNADVLRWTTGNDVDHPEFGHGWVQGSGHGRVTVRFETRTTGAGFAKTFALDDPDLHEADPLVSLDWPEQHLRFAQEDD